MRLIGNRLEYMYGDDVAPVVHGEWTCEPLGNDNWHVECDCGWSTTSTHNGLPFDYCPGCGKKMSGCAE